MKTLISIFVCTLVVLTSCIVTERHNNIVLVDASETISEETMQEYISIIQNDIIPNLGCHDRLIIQFIDGCAVTKSERLFDLNLNNMNFTNRLDGMNYEKDSARARLKRFLADSISLEAKGIIQKKRIEREDCASYTDIINALNEIQPLLTYEKNFSSNTDMAKNYLDGEDNYQYKNVIIVFSDGVNEDKEKMFDFTKFADIDKPAVLEKVESLKSLNKIPKLTDCTAFFYGATSTVKSSMKTNKQIENCKIFWNKFFDESGASLKAYAFDCKKEIVDYMLASNNTNQ